MRRLLMKRWRGLTPVEVDIFVPAERYTCSQCVNSRFYLGPKAFVCLNENVVDGCRTIGVQKSLKNLSFGPLYVEFHDVDTAINVL